MRTVIWILFYLVYSFQHSSPRQLIAEVKMPRNSKSFRRSTFGEEIAFLEKKRFSAKSSITGNVSAIEDDNNNSEKLVRKSHKKDKLQMSLLGIDNGLDNLAFDSDDESPVEETNISSLKMSVVKMILEEEELEDDLEDTFDASFESAFAPSDMRCLALVAHNHMKPAMKAFVVANKNLLKHFRLTGTNTTMTMLREVFGNDPSVEYGPTCTSGPLGGDAELVAVMCTENLGGCVFFQDPMSAHPHTADIDCLNRQANVHNILMMTNPATAFTVLTTLRIALKEGRADLIPSFFQTLESPSVAEYKVRQAKVVQKNKD